MLSETRIDIRNKPNECIYGVENGGSYKIIIEYDYLKFELDTTYKQLDDVIDSLNKQCGEKPYTELIDENDRLKVKVEELNNIIEQYEEHQDVLREKYYQPF